MSSIVAVVGGTGRLGRTIVESIKNHGKHTVLILSRAPNSEKEKDIGAKILAVDYSDVNALMKTIDDNRIDTIISTLTSTEDVTLEGNLIEAANKSISARRFIPSNWGIKYRSEHGKIFPIAKAKLAALELLEKTHLEFTTWYIGFFLDYYIAPPVPTYMEPLVTVVDMEYNTAAIPGSGDDPVVCSYSFDVGKFVAASLELPKWHKETYLVGDKLTWNEFVKIAEEVKGIKFHVTYDSVKQLRSGHATPLPSHSIEGKSYVTRSQIPFLVAWFGYLFATGMFDFKDNHTINQDFPNIQSRSVKELLMAAWGKN